MLSVLNPSPQAGVIEKPGVCKDREAASSITQDEARGLGPGQAHVKSR